LFVETTATAGRKAMALLLLHATARRMAMVTKRRGDEMVAMARFFRFLVAYLILQLVVYSETNKDLPDALWRASNMDLG